MLNRSKEIPSNEVNALNYLSIYVCMYICKCILYVYACMDVCMIVSTYVLYKYTNIIHTKNHLLNL